LLDRFHVSLPKFVLLNGNLMLLTHWSNYFANEVDLSEPEK
jgi:hypothetical protein